MINRRSIILLFIFAVVLPFSLLVSCKTGSMNGMLIITRASGKVQHMNLLTGDAWRFLPTAQIAAMNPDKPGSLKVLTGEFNAACFPEISYDGKHMLFAAQKKEGGLWQIWEMDLGSLKSRQVVSLSENCVDPAYLPGGRAVFTRCTGNDTVKTAHCLYTCNLDGSDVRQITFLPGASFATSVLKDGRLLTISRQLFPGQGDPMLTVLRPDGTKADMFYPGCGGSTFTNRPRETSDGRIVFAESDTSRDLAGDVISISYNRPLHTRVNLTEGIDGSFFSVLPLQPGRFLVTLRKPDAEHYALYEFDPVNKILGAALCSDPGYDIIDVVAAGKYDRPKKLPSEVDLQVKTGLLLCQDINFTGFQSTVNNHTTRKASMIEVLGTDSAYGIVPVEEDGSFYLKVIADTPFKIRTLDEDGHVIDGPCTWLWLRPNERRGCVGCHEDPELVPVNRIPLAVKTNPAIIPVHITKVKEKVVELE